MAVAPLWIDDHLETIYDVLAETPVAAATTHRAFAAPAGALTHDASHEAFLVPAGRHRERSEVAPGCTPRTIGSCMVNAVVTEPYCALTYWSFYRSAAGDWSAGRIMEA